MSFLPITSTNDRKEVGDTVSYLLDKHVIKGGVDYNDTGIDQVFKGNWRGVFVFNSKADLLAGRWAQYRQFGGLNGLTADQAGQAKFRQKESALFLQDQWFVPSNLTVTAGVRWENLDNPNDPILNPNDRNANGSFKLNGQVPDANNQLSPRLSISWAPDEKTAVRVSVGRYWSRTPAILFAQLFTSNGIRAHPVHHQRAADQRHGDGRADRSAVARAGDATSIRRVWAPIDFSQITNIAKPGVFAIDPNFDNPYTDRFTLGRRAGDLRPDLPGPRLHLRRGQAAPAPDGHQPRLRRHDGAQRPAALQLDPAEPLLRPHHHPACPTPSRSTRRSRPRSAAATPTTSASTRAVTWSKDKDNDSNERNFSGIQAEDFNNLDLNYGYSNRDQRWKGVVNGVWESPFWGLGLSGSLPLRHRLAVHRDSPAATSTTTATAAPTGRRSTACTSTATASASRTSTASTCGSPRASRSGPGNLRSSPSASTARTRRTAS